MSEQTPIERAPIAQEEINEEVGDDVVCRTADESEVLQSPPSSGLIPLDHDTPHVDEEVYRKRPESERKVRQFFDEDDGLETPRKPQEDSQPQVVPLEVLNDWFNAVVKDDVDQVKRMLEQKVDINTRIQNGWTALHLAVKENSQSVFDFLLANNVEVNATSISGETSLVLGVLNERDFMVQKLLEQAANPALGCVGLHQEGLTPLHIAAQNGNPVIAKALIDHGAQTDAGRAEAGITPLHDAAKHGNLNVVKLLLAAGCSVNTEGKGGLIPLHGAAIGGHNSVVQVLLENKSDLNKEAVDDKGEHVLALHMAVENGHVDVVNTLLNAGCDVNAAREYQNKDGVTSLHLASKRGHIELIKALIEYNANINAKDGDEFTALHHACRHGFVDIVKLLLDAKSDVNAGGISSQARRQTSLQFAVRHQHYDIIKLLLSAGCDPNIAEEMVRYANVDENENGNPDNDVHRFEEGYSPLHWACDKGDLQAVTMLIAGGADVNKAASFDGHHGVTPLHLASQDGHTAVVAKLVREKCDINAQKNTEGRMGISALHQAVYNGCKETVTILLGAGAKVNIQSENGYTPLHYACQRGNEELVKMLIEKDCDVSLQANYKDHRDVTALHLAAQHNHAGIVKLLVDSGANINCTKSMCIPKPIEDHGAQQEMQEIHGITPLHQACSNQHADTVRMLADLQCDVNAKAAGGYSSLHWAVERGSLPIVEILLAAKIDVNAVAGLGDHGNVMPLHIACATGNVAIVDKLVDGGADVNACRTYDDRKDITPLHIACEYGDAQSVESLITHGALLDAIDSMGFTPLHVAVKFKYEEVAGKLLQAGCDLRQTNYANQTAEKMAATMENNEILDMIKKEKKNRKHGPVPVKQGDSTKGSGSFSLFTLLCGSKKSAMADEK